ncbi:MAG: hypothetical protein FK731_14820 [Asgard group archaeon]|nr:hypothetical protein [Asgard group archaeon]
MGINFQSAKNLCKLGLRLLIGLLSIDVLWTLIRYVVIKTSFNDVIPDIFVPIDLIITNVLFIICIVILAIGSLVLGSYYFKTSKLLSIYSCLLFIILGIKLMFIVCQFIVLTGNFDNTVLNYITQIFELAFNLIFISSFIIFNFFQKHLKEREKFGFGHGIIPYVYTTFALIYPIINILNLSDISFSELKAVNIVLHMLSYTAVIIEAILIFDMMRRFDALEELPSLKEENKLS